MNIGHTVIDGSEIVQAQLLNCLIGLVRLWAYADGELDFPDGLQEQAFDAATNLLSSSGLNYHTPGPDHSDYGLEGQSFSNFKDLMIVFFERALRGLNK